MSFTVKALIALIILEELYAVAVYARILPDTFHLLKFIRNHPPIFMNPRMAILILGVTFIIAASIWLSLAAT